MKPVIFSANGIAQYNSWIHEGNRAILNRIDRLITSCLDTPFDGIGKPHPVSKTMQGMWARRIGDKDRLIYSVTDKAIVIHQCRGHYEDT